MENDWVRESPPLFATRKLKGNVPTLDGDPVIEAVSPLTPNVNPKPSGSDPLTTVQTLAGAYPPVAFMDATYAALRLPSARDVVKTLKPRSTISV